MPPPHTHTKEILKKMHLEIEFIVANYPIKLNIATELKTYCSIDYRLKISEGGTQAPLYAP